MSAIITNRSLDSHAIPETWLRSRVAGWMWNICNGMPWVVVTNTADGKTITGASSMEYGQAFDSPRMAYATKVAAYLNRECAHGGAWLAAWIGTEQFILLWKDQDGDLQIQNSCDVAWESIREWDMEDWAEQAEQAHGVYVQMNAKMEWRREEQVKLAQGQRTKH